MTTQELHEQIRAYVAERVDQEAYRTRGEQQAFAPERRAEYQAEVATKMVVRDRFSRSPASDSPRQGVAGRLDRNAANGTEETGRRLPAAPSPGFLDRFAESYRPIGGIVAALLIVVGGGAYLVMGGHEPASPLVVAESAGAVVDTTIKGHPQNFFNKASDNFESLLAGSLHVQLASKEPEELKQYFKQNGVAYDVSFLPLRMPLEGGVVSQLGRTRLAQLIYGTGESLVYLFEAPYDQLVKGDVIYVTPDVLSQLDGGKPIWVEPAPNKPVVLFKRDMMVYAVAANIPRSELQGLLGL